MSKIKQNICPVPKDYVKSKLSDGAFLCFQLSINENQNFTQDQWAKGNLIKVSKKYADKRINLAVKQSNWVDCPNCSISQPFKQVINTQINRFKCEFCDEHFSFTRLKYEPIRN